MIPKIILLAIENQHFQLLPTLCNSAENRW